MKSLSESMWAGINSRVRYSGPSHPIDQNVTGSDPNQYQAPVENTAPYMPGSLFTQVDHCASLRDWQQELVTRLRAQNHPDVYILAQAGSGKTPPVVCYWVNNILGLNTGGRQFTQIQDTFNRLTQLLSHPEELPQVLWLTPIQALNANMAQEFTERFVSIILQFLNTFTNRTTIGQQTPDPAHANDPKQNIGPQPVYDHNNLVVHNFLRQSIQNMAARAGGEAGRIANTLNHTIRVNNPDITSPDNLTIPENQVENFRLNLGDLVRIYVKNCLVGIQQEGTSSWSINNTQQAKPFVACIYESAKNIINRMDNLRLIVCDEAQRLQGSGDQDDTTRARQIANSMHETLMSRNVNQPNVQMIMLSGTVSPASTANLTHFLNVTYNRRFPNQPFTSPDKNPSTIRVLPMANLDDKFTQLRIIRTALAGNLLRQGGIVYIIFGKDRINQLIDELAPSEQGISAPRPGLSSSKNSIFSKRNVDEISRPGELNDISDERLRRAVSNGIGFLYRPQEEMNPSNQKDFSIVQSLFKTGKIRVLICTDAIREGINVQATEMYLPTIVKPPDNKPMDIGGLNQLLNRNGRKENVTATIYTDSRYVGDVVDALSGDFNRFGEQSYEFPGFNNRNAMKGIDPTKGNFIERSKARYDQMKTSYNKAEAAANYWAGLMMGRR